MMLGRRNAMTPDASKAGDKKQRPRIEALERRALLAGLTFTVTNPNDSGPGSLRDAITQLNQDTAGPTQTDTINFNLGDGTFTIALQSELPAITRPVVINGPVQPSGGRIPGAPAVVIDGSAATSNTGAGARGLTLLGYGGSQVNNLSIVGFGDGTGNGGRAILVDDGGGDSFTNNYIGIDIDGVTARPNVVGIEVLSPNTRIGPGATGNAGTQGNLISGNAVDGLLINGSGATNVSVVGNRIGTDRTGIGSVGNLRGIEVRSATGVTIGGTDTLSRNTISGNLGPDGLSGIGVLFSGTANGNVVAGNNIGTDSTGQSVNSNAFGISLGAPVANNTVDQITNITIGGTAAGTANVISGNGIAIYGTTTRSSILGNLIGSNSTGTGLLQSTNGPVGNGTGIQLGGGANAIGGSAAGARNLIVGSGTIATSTDPLFGTALRLSGSAYVVQGNIIGVGLNGQALPNIHGVFFNASNSQIGGTAFGAGNYIAASLQDGLTLTGQPSNTIQGNLIGSPLGGNLGNALNGIRVALTDPNTVNSANDILPVNNAIGGLLPGAGNIIAGNGQNGVAISSTYGGYTGLVIQGNSISDNGVLGISSGPVLGTPQANSLQITSADTQGTTSTVQGLIVGAPGQSYTIDLYNNAQADPSGYGEGQTYVGTVIATVSVAGFVNFTANLPVPLGPNSFVTATATPFGPSYIGSTSEFSTSFPNATPKANLVVTQQVSPSTSVGGNVTILATITNTGAGAAQGVVFTDVLNNALVNVQTAASVGSAVLGPANTVYAALGTLAPGASAQVAIIAGTSASLVFGNTIGVISLTPETNYADNLSSVPIQISPPVRPTADLVILSSSPTSVGTVGTPLSLVMNVTNNGPNSVDNTTVTAFLPTGLNFINGAGTQGTPVTVRNAVIQGNLGTLAPGASAQLVLNVVATTSGNFTIPSNVSSSLIDPITANNSAVVAVSILPRSGSNAATAASTTTTGGTTTGGTSGAVSAETLVGPTVVGVTGSRSNAQLNVAFSAPVTAATATTKANYLLYDLGSTPRALTAADRPIAITSIFRNAGGSSVTLTPSRAIRAGHYYTLVVVGSTARGITDTSGRKLVGTSGDAATNYQTTFRGGSLAQNV